jgi:hypothetical protein
MYKIRGGIAVIIATILGVVLLIVALSTAQDAMQITAVGKEDLFTITGQAYFTEREEEQLWRPKKEVYIQVQAYPAPFFIANKTGSLTAASLTQGVDTTVRITIPKVALGLLQTRSVIKLYELETSKGKMLYSFADAVNRDKADRKRLYLQAVLCFLGGLVLLIFPKRFLVKQ